MKLCKPILGFALTFLIGVSLATVLAYKLPGRFGNSFSKPEVNVLAGQFVRCVYQPKDKPLMRNMPETGETFLVGWGDSGKIVGVEYDLSKGYILVIEWGVPKGIEGATSRVTKAEFHRFLKIER